MTQFAANSSMGRTTGAVSKINILDVGLVAFIFMLTFLVGSLWLVEPSLEFIPLIKSIGLNAIMLALAGVALVIYLFASFTGGLENLKLISPFWLISATVSIPIWILFASFMPLTSATSQVVSENINLLVTLLGVDVFNFIQLVWVYATVESLTFGILLIVFLGVTSKTKGNYPRPNSAKAGSFVLPAFVMIVLFMTLLHGAIALALDVSGSLDFLTVMIHQFVAFFIMGLAFFLAGMAGNIAFHHTKNTLGLALPIQFWIILFLIYGFFTFLAIKQAGKKDMNLSSAFGVRGLGAV